MTGIVWVVLWLVHGANGAELAAALAYIGFAAWVLLSRKASRLAFKEGWLVGFRDGVDLRQELDDRKMPTPVLRQQVTGDPSPEPWEV